MKTVYKTVSKTVYTCLGTFVFLSGVSAQIKTDASLGQSAKTLTGPNFAITSDLGKQVGGNLFHSFSTFNLVKGDVATFSGLSTVSNIISRVTGGQTSNIDGTLKSAITGANLYFLNPAGVIFGPSSSVDITGSFHVTTADYLKLGTDGRFDAANPANSTLTISPPSAFGFISTKPAAITVNGAGSDYAYRTYGLNGLYVKPGKELSIIGGDISLNSGILDQQTAPFFLVARGGRLNMASVASSGEVAIEDNNLAMNGFTHLGNITLSDGGKIDLNPKSFSGPSGNLYVRGNNLQSNGFMIGAFSNDSYVGGDIDINLTGDMLLDKTSISSSGSQYYKVNNATITNGSKLTSSGERDIVFDANKIYLNGYDSSITSIYGGVNHGGGINLSANEKISVGSAKLYSESIIFSYSSGIGNSGNISINTPNLELIDYGLIKTGSSFSASTTANSGDISITSKNVIISNGSAISVRSGIPYVFDAKGNSGNIHIEAETLLMQGGQSFLDSASIFAGNYGSGKAGDIVIHATKNIILNGKSVLQGASISAPNTSGKGGTITMTTDSMLLEKGVYIAATSENGAGGNIDLSANNITFQGGEITTGATINGTAGNINVTANKKFQLGGVTDSTNKVDIISQIDSLALADASAGSIAIAGREVVIGDGGKVSVQTYGTGSGGNLSINSSLLDIDNGKIYSDTSGKGNAGNIAIDTDSMSLSGLGSTILLSTSATGNAGNVSINARDFVSLTGGGNVSTNTKSSGHAGTVKVRANNMTIDGQGILSTGFFSDSLPGGSTGDAGNIDIITSGKLSVISGGIISTSTGGTGKAGTVQMSADTLLVDGVAASINAKAATGSSGQTGSVTVLATDKMTISNGGTLSIQNDATVTNPDSLSPTLLTVTAPTIVLKDAKITAASTGNVSASSIQITASERLSIDPSSISTSANLGNGGSITLQGGKMMTLDNSQITTSVAGLTGNGGDIHVSANTLMMNTGFIQANTAAANAAGGLVGIDVQMLVPSGSSLFVGGQTPYSFQSGVFGFNVIQAAAPTGVSGTIQMTSPALDIAGSLNGLSTQVINTGGLGRSPCQITGGSSLAQSGRGGLPPSALGLLRAEPDLEPAKPGAPTLGKASLPLAFTPGRCS